MQTKLRSIHAPRHHPDAKKPAAEKEDRKRMFEYSNKNKITNPPPPYSTLKPDTSSDSPSTKSKGARFVSATVEINHITNTGNKITAGHHHIRVSEWVLKLKHPLRNPDVMNKIKNLAS